MDLKWTKIISLWCYNEMFITKNYKNYKLSVKIEKHYQHYKILLKLVENVI